MSSRKTKNATPAGSKKQGTLFSFFTRLPSKGNESKSSTTPPLSKETSLGQTSSTGKATKGTTEVSSQPQSSQKASHATRQCASSKTALPANSGKVKQVTVNMKLAVFWPDDKRYYPATVKKIRHDKFFLEYDDATSEWIDLRYEKFRFIDDEDEDVVDSDNDTEDEEIVPKRTAQRGRPKKRPRIIESDDEEFEMDDATEEQEAEEMEEDFVDDDEEANPPSRKKSVKKGIKSSVTVQVVHEPVSSSSMETPKVSSVSASGDDTRPATTPTSLDSFSAFSKSAGRIASNTTQADSINQVTPPSLTKTTTIAAAQRASEPETDKEEALPYVLKATNPAGSHVHNHLKFLRNPRDARGKSKGDPGYSGRTLKVDYEELKKHTESKQLSPGVLQWWETKAQVRCCHRFFGTSMCLLNGTIRCIMLLTCYRSFQILLLVVL
jgi:hypothetical protein